MNYEITERPQITIVGVSAETSFTDPDMPRKIEKLWQELYQTGMHMSIKNKVNERAIGLYSDYQANGAYIATAGNEVSICENPELSCKVIPAGKYAKFSIHGIAEEVVPQAWAAIAKLNLNRSFIGDYEEYLNADMNAADIDIYIAIK